MLAEFLLRVESVDSAGCEGGKTIVPIAKCIKYESLHFAIVFSWSHREAQKTGAHFLLDALALLDSNIAA